LGLTSTPQVSNLLLTVEAAQPSEFNTRRKPPRPGSRTHVWSFKWTPKPVVLELSGITGRSGQVSGQKAVFDTAAYTGKTWGLLRLIRAGDPALDKKTGQVNCVWRARKSKDSTETFELEGYFKADGEANPFDPAFFDGFKLPNNLYEAPK
jgi:type VI protein secretion system component VasK